ncbi:hypothetical protein [Pseudoalteromonas luteoviolacea]|uniref:Uncharacterized protein n=1 Tax=Pseudoalteromonas luteoviolacea S4054 TaxID=1129367 RepID=A0A0F6AD30_9GAMM|nr:hypothetical protein [Pseudoalteromonas luteoviolacea]AOT09849.1 hypothetical protein S4054249_19350 [Pseudoalteromonas luteoviolacea]AOT14761.1 hypothetical protein S40542_19320 [Pseudoalteromonas luteoviolacea]AOT19676.1 hypothetical protein S4054_19325 [Pseudoalteromonas luteoviolacea]KKE84122.1 hypothetical protein N479_11975 [Pseudoalteromonas luteoviolacea S4054]KZN77516.1 hypothetical protein N481_05515 [Pseudoalteromonas luteoviolacea S4047-1]
MKAVSLLLFSVLIVLLFSWLSMPFISLSLSGFIEGLGWVGLELFGFLLVMIFGFAVVALLSVGILGVGLVVLIGLVLALLFNSVMIAIPLFMLLILAWLVFEKTPEC